MGKKKERIKELEEQVDSLLSELNELSFQNYCMRTNTDERIESLKKEKNKIALQDLKNLRAFITKRFRSGFTKELYNEVIGYINTRIELLQRSQNAQK